MKSAIALLLLSALLCGCQTTYSKSRQTSDARLQTDIRNLRADVARLESRLEESELGRQDLYSRMQVLEGEVTTRNRELRRDLDGLTAKLAQLETARVADRQKLIDELSGKMADMLKSSGGGSRGARTATGYEHEVKPGQTLSEIAAVYGVRAQAIIEANQLTNPNAIRVGQKLFIPE